MSDGSRRAGDYGRGVSPLEESVVDVEVEGVQGNQHEFETQHGFCELACLALGYKHCVVLDRTNAKVTLDREGTQLPFWALQRP